MSSLYQLSNEKLTTSRVLINQLVLTIDDANMRLHCQRSGL